MTFPRSQLAKIEEPLWFCLKAQPKREHIAAAALRQYDVASFCPRIRHRKLTKRGAIWFVEPMFPGYLFAQFVYADLHRRVQHSAAIQKIVAFGEQIAVVEPETIAFLHQAAGDDEVVTIDPEVREGPRVRVAEGPLRGLEALVVKVVPGKERVRILLEMLGRSITAEIATPGVLIDRS